MDKYKLIKFALVYTIKTNLPFFFRKPIRVSIDPTKSCNSKCRHCLAWKNKDFDSLSTGEWKRIIRELKTEFGLFFLTFNSNGEPFLRKDILELVEFVSNEGLPVNINTNGTLINKEIADKITASKLYMLSISLDSINPSTYKRIRGIDKLNKLLSNIRCINKNKRNLKLKIATTISKYNLIELEELVRFAKNEKIPILFQPLTPRPWSKDYLNPDWPKASKLWPNPKAAEKVIDRLIALKKEGCPIINSIKHFKLMKAYFKNPNQIYKNIKPACSRLLRIRSDGEAKLCLFQPSLGSLKSQHINQIFDLRKVKKHIKRPEKCRGCVLRNCNFL